MCDGMVCFKVLFCDFRGLMRIQSVWLDSRLRFELGLCVYEGLPPATWASWWVIRVCFADRRRSFSTEFQNVLYHTSIMRLMYSEIFWPLHRRLATRRTLYQTVYFYLFALLCVCVCVCVSIYIYIYTFSLAQLDNWNCYYLVTGGSLWLFGFPLATKSRVRFPMVSLGFFVDITLPAALWPWG